MNGPILSEARIYYAGLSENKRVLLAELFSAELLALVAEPMTRGDFAQAADTAFASAVRKLENLDGSETAA